MDKAVIACRRQVAILAGYKNADICRRRCKVAAGGCDID